MKCALLIVLGFGTALSQQSTRDGSAEVLQEADTIALNIQTAIEAHLSEPDFVLKKQKPELKLRCFDMLVFKDGSIKLDWTVGQHARCRMEDLRQGIHELQQVAWDRRCCPPARQVSMAKAS